MIPEKLTGYNVNGKTLYPLSDEERQRQIRAIEKRREKIEKHLASITSEEEMVNELAMCFNDFFYFCEYYCYTFDPRPLDPTKNINRFILYDYQKVAATEIINHIEQGRNLLIEKSRDMGASWIVDVILTWFFLFRENFQAHLGSRAEKEVDDGTVDSLFGKIDFVIERLPDWMRAQLPYDRKKQRKHLHISSFENSLISGESTNPNFGRGPRKKVVILDEAAAIECDREIWKGTSETAPCRILISTPNGDVNLFAELRFSGKIDVLTFHWTSHPYKTVEWYERRRTEDDAETIASELDIDYKASGGRMAFPQIKLYKSRIIIPAFEPDPKDFYFDMGLDHGTTNPTSIHVYIRSRTQRKSEILPKSYSIWEYFKPDGSIKEAANAILTCPWYPLVQHVYADPSMWFNNQTGDDGRGVTNLAAQYWAYFKILLSMGRRGDAFPITQLALAWSDPQEICFQIFETCENQVREFEGLKFIKSSSAQAQKKNAPERLQDKNNHTWDDFKYWFNQTFSGSLIEDPVERLNGYDAFNRDVAGLKMDKLKKLTENKKRNRRVFRHV